MSQTTIQFRGESVEVTFHDHGYEPDTNAHEIDWEFVELPADPNITADEEMSVLDQLYLIVNDPYYHHEDFE